MDPAKNRPRFRAESTETAVQYSKVLSSRAAGWDGLRQEPPGRLEANEAGGAGHEDGLLLRQGRHAPTPMVTHPFVSRSRREPHEAEGLRRRGLHHQGKAHVGQANDPGGAGDGERRSRLRDGQVLRCSGWGWAEGAMRRSQTPTVRVAPMLQSLTPSSLAVFVYHSQLHHLHLIVHLLSKPRLDLVGVYKYSIHLTPSPAGCEVYAAF